MSECVVRMEMPQNCEECPCACTDASYNGWCEAGKFELDYDERKKTIHPNCPIICSLPEGHGRLVDADNEIAYHISDFERIKNEGQDVYGKNYSLSDVCDCLTDAYDNAVVIVPAERSENEAD